jgi:hypothetical protein
MARWNGKVPLTCKEYRAHPAPPTCKSGKLRTPFKMRAGQIPAMPRMLYSCARFPKRLAARKLEQAGLSNVILGRALCAPPGAGSPHRPAQRGWPSAQAVGR